MKNAPSHGVWRSGVGTRGFVAVDLRGAQEHRGSLHAALQLPASVGLCVVAGERPPAWWAASGGSSA